jgi:type III secretory pathway component EscR
MQALQTDPTHEVSFNRLPLREECKQRLNRLKQDIVQRPFFSLAIAFAAGLLSQTFPVRLLFVLVFKVVSWLASPVILALGAVKVFEIVSSQKGVKIFEDQTVR